MEMPVCCEVVLLEAIFWKMKLHLLSFLFFPLMAGAFNRDCPPPTSLPTDKQENQGKN